MLSRKQARYMEFFSRFSNMKWNHIAGRTNVADPLSRHPTFSTALTVERIHPDDPIHSREIFPDILLAYKRDSWFRCPRNTQHLTLRPDGYWVGSGRSKRSASETQIVVPNGNALKSRILFAFHDTQRSGHPGFERTFNSIGRYYWWPAMRLDVNDYVRSCHSCQSVKASHQRSQGTLQPLPIPTAPFDSLSMDFIVGLPKSEGYDMIFVIVDRLTKMVKLAPCKTTDGAEQIAKIFHRIILSEQGTPTSLITDRDVKFTSAFWKTIQSLCTIEPGMSTAFHPQTDGQTERMNSVLEDTLRHFTSTTQKNWSQLLPNAQFAINNSYNSSIRDFPFRLLYGRYPRVALQPPDTILPHDSPQAVSWVEHMTNALDCAKKALQAAQDRQRTYANQHRRPVTFLIGQEVMLSTKNLKYWPGRARKLLPRFVGPFPVTRVYDKHGETLAATLDLPVGWRIHPTFHVSLLKAYVPDGSPMIRPNPDHFRTTDEPVYEIGKVVDHKIESGLLRYYVQWLHSDHVHTWELESDLAGPCATDIDMYWRQNPDRSRPIDLPPVPDPHAPVRPRTRREASTETPDEYVQRTSTRLREKSRAREGGNVTDNDPSPALPRGGDDFPEEGELTGPV